ncbi:hypothetical protein IT087_00525 [Candidatus Uhrbacteria bacterium]|nr:hypothetical protein [Candidatus Uhrbacteria bacterium]
MHTGKFVIGEFQSLLVRFTHWSTVLVGIDLDVVIRPNRAINGSQDLTAEERAELYEVAIPATEKIIEEAMRDRQEEGLTVTQRWMGKEMRLSALGLKPGQYAMNVYDAHRRAIDAAA